MIEVRGVVNATPGTQTATGTLIDTDVDNPPNTFTAVSSPTKSKGGYGTFTAVYGIAWLVGAAIIGVLYDHGTTAVEVFVVVVSTSRLLVFMLRTASE